MSDGTLLHFVGARLRVVGSGVLRLTMKSRSDVNQDVMPTINMAASSNIMPLSLSNFIDQGGRLRIETTGFDESFTISAVTVFVTEFASGLPQ